MVDYYLQRSDYLNDMGSSLNKLGTFLTAMTFHRVRVEPYMTKISFLTAFFCASARPKKALQDSTWSKIQQILCCVHVRAEKSLKQLVNFT